MAPNNAFLPVHVISGPALRPGSFSARFKYGHSDERNYVVQVAKLAGKDKTRIHVLTDNRDAFYGFVALSLDVSDGRPALVIDYLFTSLQYRGISFHHLQGKISDYLIGYCIHVANVLKQHVPLRFVSLQPATEELELFYVKRAFRKLDATHWLFLRI